MTYPEIIEKLKELRLGYVQTQLEQAVQIEAKALQDYEVQQNKRKLTQKFLGDCLERAQAFYAGDISSFYVTNGQIQPDHILNNRRMGAAWAIAQKMLEAACRNCPLCGEVLVYDSPRPLYDPTTSTYFNAETYQCSTNHVWYFRGADMPQGA
jgi:hypothetical protein